MKIKKTYFVMGFLVLILFLTVSGLKNQSLEPQYELEYPRESASDIIIKTPENKTYTEPMSGYYPGTYGFENDEIGSDPAGWDVFEGAGYVNVKDEMYNHKNIIEMYDNTNSNHDELHNLFQLQTSGTLEFWVMSDDASQTLSIIILDDAATSVWGDSIGWIQIYQDKIRYQDVTDWHDTSKTISDNTWYHLKIEFECTTGNYQGLAQDTYRFYVDGELFGDYAFRNNIDNVSQIYCATRGSDTNYRCYVDAFGFSWDSNYVIGDNINEGLLLSFDNTYLDWMGYSLDGLANKTILGNKTIPMPLDGQHRIQVFGNNTMGSMLESDIRFFGVNTIPPAITINSPLLNNLNGHVPPSFDLTILDPDLTNRWYSLDGGTTNVTFTGFAGSIDQTEWDKIGNGTVTIIFYANDTVNNIGHAEVLVRKDIIAPVVSITSPTTAEEFENTPIFDIIIDDGSNLDEFWYTIDNGATNYTITSLTGTINAIAWDAALDGPVTIQFYARDDAGNIGTDTVIITKNTPDPTPPPGIPGYDLYLLIGTLGVISILLIRKRVK